MYLNQKILKKEYLSFEKRYFFLSIPSKGVHRQLTLTLLHNQRGWGACGGTWACGRRGRGSCGIFFFSFSVGESKLNVPKVVLYATYRVSENIYLLKYSKRIMRVKDLFTFKSIFKSAGIPLPLQKGCCVTIPNNRRSVEPLDIALQSQ